MRTIEYKNCGNIKEVAVSFILNEVNLKFVNNGVGKSTLGKSLLASIRGDEGLLNRYIPFYLSYSI